MGEQMQMEYPQYNQQQTQQAYTPPQQAPAPAPQAATKKPKMTLKAKKEALADIQKMVMFCSINDEEYEQTEGLDRLMTSLEFEIAKAEDKKG